MPHSSPAAPGPHGGRADAWRWLGPGLALLFVAAALLFWRGHVLDEEAVGFLRKYWSERGALQKIFDVRGWDFYQGRELSYAIDYLDAQWVRLLASRDVLFFVPPSSLLASLAVVWVALRLAPRALPSLPSAGRWLAFLVLLSSFVYPATMGILYRATKPIVAPLLLALFLFALAEHREPRARPARAFWTAFALALAMSLLDRQGLFYVLAFGGVLALAWLRTRRGLPLLAGSAVAVVAWYGYFRGLGPWLIHALEGYWPSDRFQRLRPARLLAPEPWRLAVDILGDWTSVLLGGLPAAALSLLVLAGAGWWAWSERRRPLRLAVAATLAAGTLLAQLTMVAMMVERHPPVAWISHRLWYYPLPYQALLLFGLLVGLDLLARHRRGTLPFAVTAVLAGVVFLNVARWPEKRAAIDGDPAFSDQLRRSALLVRSLQQGRAEPLLDGDHRRFYFEFLDAFPPFARRSLVQAGEGQGVLLPEIRDGRVTALAEQQSHLVARTTAPGRHVLAGTVRLRPGDALEVLLGTPPRRVAALERQGLTEGPERLRVELDLASGANDVLLLSRLPDRRVPDRPRRTFAAYELQLPFVLWPLTHSAQLSSAPPQSAVDTPKYRH